MLVSHLDFKPLPSMHSEDSMEGDVLEFPKQIVYPVPPPTSNVLSKARRAQLRRTSNKLRKLLGETPAVIDSDLDERVRARRHAGKYFGL